MFPKQEFKVQITDEKLLNTKRGTLKKSTQTNNYSLMKTADSIFVNHAEPLRHKDFLLGFVQSKIDLTNENQGTFQAQVSIKPFVKFMLIAYLFLTFIIFIQNFFLADTIVITKVFLPIILLPALFVLLYKLHQSVKVMTTRLQTDKSIFVTN